MSNAIAAKMPMTPDKVTHGDLPGGGSYALAFGIPVVGMVLAIVTWARGHVGPGLALISTAMFGAVVWTLVLVALAISQGASS